MVRQAFYLPERIPAPSPAAMRCAHFWLATGWLILIPISILAGWIYAVVFVSAISIYANVVGHWSGLSAERPTETGERLQ